MPSSPPDLFELSPDPACLMAWDGALLAANAAFRDAFRHPITPRRPPWGRAQPPAFDAAGERRFEAAAPDGRVFEWRERRLEDGARLAVARDVTDRAAAAEAARAKTLVFAMLTHELRTPLNGILGLAGLLGHEPLTPAQADHVRSIQQSGERLLELISDALDYARLEAGRAQIEVAPFDPLETAQGVVELLAPRARDKGLELVLEAGRDAPGPVLSDENRLRQILFNLVGNALKFTEAGGVSVRVRGTPKGEDETLLSISVRDTGLGVPPEKRAQIFQAFEQADASHARAYGGAGLGLAIVKRLSDLLGGRITLADAPGGGSRFTFEARLPTAAPSAPSPRLDGLAVRLEVGSPLLRAALTAAVEGGGGQIAREGVLLFEPREDAPLPAAPAVALLWPDARERIPALQAAGLGYLIKPVRMASLAQQVRAAAEGRSAPGGRLAAAPEVAASAHRPALSGLRVLLAEDNPLNALIARTVLTRAGAAVETAVDGEEAIAAARRGGFDAYLLDLRMPVLDGLAAARQIRALHPHARILALTADAGEEERQAAFAAGMDAFLTKAIEAERLAAALRGAPAEAPA